MTDWPEPTFTDTYALQKKEEEYAREFQIHQKWRVVPQVIEQGVIDSSFCAIHTDRSEEFGNHSKDFAIVPSTIRGIWAQHIVYIHNEWLAHQS